MLDLAAAGAKAVPVVRLGAQCQVFVDLEFGFAGEQVVAEGVDVELVKTICGHGFGLRCASHGGQVLRHHSAEVKVATVLCNLGVAQRANVVVYRIVVQQAGAQKDVSIGANFHGQVDVVAVRTACAFEFVSSRLGVRNEGFQIAGAHFTGVQTHE